MGLTHPSSVKSTSWCALSVRSDTFRKDRREWYASNPRLGPRTRCSDLEPFRADIFPFLSGARITAIETPELWVSFGVSKREECARLFGVRGRIVNRFSRSLLLPGSASGIRLPV